MDAIEGEGTNYVRRPIDLFKADGSKLSAMTYVVEERGTDLKTSPAYVKHMFDGLKEHCIPEEYRQYVVSRIIDNNPDLQKEILAATRGA